MGVVPVKNYTTDDWRDYEKMEGTYYRLKSVVREIRTLRSEGAGVGRPPPATQWRRS